MTMPHLMNCPHSATGWCLPCVAELKAEQDKVVVGRYDGMCDLPEGHTAYTERMAKIVKSRAGSIRESIKKLEVELQAERSELRDWQEMCPHLGAVMQWSNSHELPDYGKCEDCGAEL